MGRVKLALARVLFALGGVQAAAGAQDLVTLADGRALEGRVVLATEDELVVRAGGRDERVARSEVRELVWIPGSLAELFERAAQVPADALAATLELARFAEARALPGEARIFYWRALLLDPENPEARAGLGHERRGKRWSVEHDGRSYDSLEELFEATAAWKHAWRFPLAHFELATNLPLERALEAALDLEHFYLEFYRVFGADFELYECTHPMEVEIHADARSFPENAGGGRAYFWPEPNTLFVDASGGLERYALAHECTHQLLYTATQLEARRSGALPSWLDEGLAEYVAASTVLPPEPLALVPGFPHRGHFARFANSERPLSLARVLALQAPDFTGNSRRLEMYAQAYALVHWCLHADGGDHRAALFAWMREAFAGKSSPSTFKKDLGLERDFEELWLAYARDQAR